MSDETNKKPWWVPRPQQEWKPNVLLQLLYRAWMLIFGTVKIALAAAATVVVILAMCMLAFGGALGDYLENEIMPQAGLNLEEFSLDQSSFVYYTDSNGEIQLLQKLHTDTDRRWADYEDIPEDMIYATIAIEDKRFFEHQGVDWFTTIKAFANMFLGDDSKGGSTITQQLVKNLTQDDSVTVQRKLLELFRATEFEQRYDKETVLEWYLNYIYLGNGCYGVRAAAETYFGKELEMLTTAECASLISITNNPSIYDPYGDTWEWRFHPDDPIEEMSGAERNGVRKEWTLGEMVTQGWITWEEYREAMEQVLVFKYGIADGDRLTTCPDESCGYRNIANNFDNYEGTHYCPVCGTAVSVVEDASLDVYSWFVDTVLEDVAEMMVERDGLEWTQSTRDFYMNLIARGGFHIYTTLDMDVQNTVDAVYGNLDEIPDTRSGQQLQSAIVVVDNRTGDIVAMAGGVGEKDVHDAWNIATDATLQTGSSIKPLTVYAPAFEAGEITPATVIKDLPLEYGDTQWDPAYPKNDNNLYSYSRTVQMGVCRSVNCVAANVVNMIGVEYSFDFGKNEFGLSGLLEMYIRYDGLEMNDIGVAQLAMGAQTLGLSVRDMSCAYATFANNGVYREGRTFTKVFDSDGNLVLDNEQESRQILSEKTVDYMNMCLFYATYYGTGTEADLDYHYVAGKTGTTNDSKDRWYCGYTKYYTAAVWSGYNTPETIRPIGCSNPSAVLWNKVMEPIHEGLTPTHIYNKSKFVSVDICLDSGKLATDACRKDARTDEDCTRVDTVYVYKEDKPKDECDVHVMMEFCPEGKGVANEWCQHFASEEYQDEATRLKLEEIGLCKVTQEDLDNIMKLEKKGIWDEFLKDEWVYLVDSKGRDVKSYQGVNGKLDQKTEAPYKVCEVHTEEAWNAYLESLIPEETEPLDPTDPNLPVDPNNPTQPTVPTEPATPTEPAPNATVGDVPGETVG